MCHTFVQVTGCEDDSARSPSVRSTRREAVLISPEMLSKGDEQRCDKRCQETKGGKRHVMRMPEVPQGFRARLPAADWLRS